MTMTLTILLLLCITLHDSYFITIDVFLTVLFSFIKTQSLLTYYFVESTKIKPVTDKWMSYELCCV